MIHYKQQVTQVAAVMAPTLPSDMADCGRADLDDLRTSHHRQPGAEPVHHRLVALLPARGYRESGPRGGWVAAPPPAAGPLEGMEDYRPGGTICGYEVSPSATSASGAVAARGIGDCGLPGPRRGPAQFLLGTPRPEDIDRDKAAFQSDGLTNRRMRARMSGGVGGEGASPSLPDPGICSHGPGACRKADWAG